MISVRLHNSLYLKFANVLQFIVLLVVAIVIHWAVLRFVFPGYYDPLWPIHSDFYLPVEIFKTPAGILSYLNWPRPVGLIFFGLIGGFGLQGAIAAIILMVMLNVVITAVLIKYLLKIKFSKKFLIVFALYAGLLFSHPYFYCFYVHDAFSQLSYFLLGCGFFLYGFFLKRSVVASLFSLFLFALLGFLAKETFGLAALGVSAVWFLYERKRSLLSAVIPFLLLFLALVISFGFNFFIKSAFVSGDSAYRANINPASVIAEWFQYVSLGYDAGIIAFLVVLVVFSFSKYRAGCHQVGFVFLGCLVAFVSSLIPNALLPDHHHNGYSWTGAYFLFAPIFLLALPGNFPKLKNLTMLLSLVFALFLVGSKNYKEYVSSPNQWFLIQENTQRNMLVALHDLIQNLDAKKVERVLVVGISFPYSPFQRPTSLDAFVGGKKVLFDVVNYPEDFKETRGSATVKNISVGRVILADYSKIWVFGGDGRLVGALSADSMPDGFQTLETLKKYILFPDVAAALGLNFPPISSSVDVKDGYKLLNAGNASFAYQQSEMALDYFRASSTYIPQNPYPWYLAGMVLEKLNQFSEAEKYFQQAVALDPDDLNPVFREAASRIEKEFKN